MRVIVAVIAVLVVAQLALGLSAGGVELHSTYAANLKTTPPPNGPPECVSAHTFDTRNWFGWNTIRRDIWVRGCNDASGHLHLSSPVKCLAKTFLGAGAATCTAHEVAGGIRVTYDVSYPFGLNLISGQTRSGSFTLSRDGGYSSP